MPKSEKREVLSTRRYKVGYEIREVMMEEGFTMKSAYTLDGDHYIGSSKLAHRLFVKMGLSQIQPHPSPHCMDADNGGGGTCSLGFNEAEDKWYGWSQRAICGFGVGDIVKKGDACATSGWTDEYLREHPKEDFSLPVGFEAFTPTDAKRMAIAFAEAVG